MSKTLHSTEHAKLVAKLKRARIESGMTQVQAASRLKKPQSYISKIERGERKIDATELAKIATTYQKSINFFYN